MDREQTTLLAMLRIYCTGRHGTRTGLCPSCEGLRAYAVERLLRCPFQPDKPTCANCEVHCYNPAMRECVREVMRYAGPRMIWRHPLLAIHHLMRGTARR